MISTANEPLPSPRTSPRWLHYLNLIWNGFTFLGFGALTVWTLVFSQQAGLEAFYQQTSDRTLYLLAYVCGFFALMALIAVVDSIRRLSDTPKSIKSERSNLLKFSILLLPLIIYAVWAWENSIILPAWIYSSLVFLGILIPVIWLVRMAAGNYWAQHRRRNASLMSLSASFTMPFIMIVQILLVILIALVFFIAQPDLLVNLPETMENPEELLKSPLVLVLAFVLLALVIPTIEELFKTLAVWPLLGLDIRAIDGFIAGLFSGAAFALLEGVLYAAQNASVSGGDWVFFILGRAGGSLIHIFNGGIVGWALAKTWKDKKLMRVLFSYGLAIFIHAIWNFTVLSTQLILLLNQVEINQIVPVASMIILMTVFGIGFAVFINFVWKDDDTEIESRPEVGYVF